MEEQLSDAYNMENNQENQFDSTHTNSFFQNSETANVSESSAINFSLLSPEKSGFINNNSGSKSGGITCCVPNCYSNSKRNKELSFYIIPKDKTLRKQWLANISRKYFKPTSSHRVCSAHFEGGKKTYMNNVPTSVPKLLAKPVIKARNSRTSLGLLPDIISPIRPRNSSENEEPEGDSNTMEIELLKAQLGDITKQKNEIENQLSKKISELESTIQQSQFSIDRFQHNKTHFKFYTGFESYELFQAVFDYLMPDALSLLYHGSDCKNIAEGKNKKGRSRTLSPQEEFFLVLVRLRCGFPIEDLGVRFNMSTSNISRTLITWYDFLHIKLRALPIWATRQTVNDTMPKSFKKLYPDTRVIIDCTEIFTEMPTSYRSQSATFSSYKHHNTAKALVGIAPSGAVTFVSDVYAGRSSDKQITRHSGILELLEPGDDLMADRGFDIETELPEGVTLNIPPFLDGEAQLSLEKELQTRRIASVRVHVERAIARIKNYRILSQTFQLSMAADLNKIWIICCYLVNFLSPLIAQDIPDE